MVSTAMPEAPAVPELDLSLEDDFALFMLIDNFNAPHCEAKHQNIDAFPCSHQPVARFAYCGPGHPMICKNTVDYVTKMWRDKKLCEDCMRLTRDCWQIQPLNLGA